MTSENTTMSGDAIATNAPSSAIDRTMLEVMVGQGRNEVVVPHEVDG
jgi:hypothetical protein